ncbi:hypothetical protein PoMZ_03501 [Pyricularia oryzae]|uniref:Uncharacterized protein n=1 Tax=Pyricularia oryzae TaxID=318829 RepID=A0A4P7NBQ9_PYROR|nr:hypothetical protein PoMZ_03501 [Pyricularia oryzae]
MFKPVPIASTPPDAKLPVVQTGIASLSISEERR